MGTRSPAEVSTGFIEELGEERVIDTPISESGIAGAAGGAAMGFRPVVEFQFADFVVYAFDQIVNFSGKCYYRWGIPVPVVSRGPSVIREDVPEEDYDVPLGAADVKREGEAFESLDAPVKRVGALDVPIPFDPPPEDAVLPSAARIEAEARKLLEY